jgi:hypothetical protein
MRNWRWIVSGLAGLTAAFAASSGLGANQVALTTAQMKALPLRLVDQHVKKDFVAVLQPVRKLSQGTRPFLHNVDQTTPPFGTGYEGLCRRDVVRLRYATTEDSRPYPDRKLRPYSVEAKAQFALRGALPVVAAAPRRFPATPALEAACDRLNGDAKIAWFYAPDEREAALALNILDAARSRVRAGTLKASAYLKGDIDLKDLDRIEPCRAGEDRVCYRYVLRGAGLMIIVAQDANRGATVDAEDIVSLNDGYVLIDDNPDGWP